MKLAQLVLDDALTVAAKFAVDDPRLACAIKKSFKPALEFTTEL